MRIMRLKISIHLANEIYLNKYKTINKLYDTFFQKGHIENFSYYYYIILILSFSSCSLYIIIYLGLKYD